MEWKNHPCAHIYASHNSETCSSDGYLKPCIFSCLLLISRQRDRGHEKKKIYLVFCLFMWLLYIF